MRPAVGAQEVGDMHLVIQGSVLSSREILFEMPLGINRPSEALIEFERSLKRDLTTFLVFALQLAAQRSQ